ncbi:hypothetical protein ABVK25_000568 [Lepraria finkii]|uniref:Uncharacterized protein n=1 Tax=Lepraria finkii TaxID=1340010 RepID=A0ABR4BNA3_9LECA
MSTSQPSQTPTYQVSNSVNPALRTPPVPDTNDTYLWTDIEKLRKLPTSVVPIQASAGKPLPLPIVQNLDSADPDGNYQLGTYKLESSSKWFTLVSSGINNNHDNVINLGIVAGKGPGAGRVIRVGSTWGGAGPPGSGNFSEYYYQVTAST